MKIKNYVYVAACALFCAILACTRDSSTCLTDVAVTSTVNGGTWYYTVFVDTADGDDCQGNGAVDNALKTIAEAENRLRDSDYATSAVTIVVFTGDPSDATQEVAYQP